MVEFEAGADEGEELVVVPGLTDEPAALVFLLQGDEEVLVGGIAGEG